MPFIERIAGGQGPQLLLGIAAVVATTLVPALSGNLYWTHTFLLVNLYVAVAVLQNMLLADAGQVSFGQGAVFGVAAYTFGLLAGFMGHDVTVSWIAGIAAAVLLGGLFALPALRVQGYYLGFVTLCVALVFPELLVEFNSFTNGVNGIQLALPAVNRPFLAGVTPLALLVMALAIAALVGHAALRRTRLGRRMQVAAASPEAALSLGFSPGKVRSIAFLIAAFGAGVAGVLYVPVVQFLSPTAFHLELSIFFFFSVIVGGKGRLIGPILGVWVLFLIPNVLLVDLVNYRLFGYGAAALAIMLAFPDGLVGTLEKRLRRARGRTDGTSVTMQWLDLAQAPAPAPATGRPAIVVADARKSYGSLAALDGVSVTIEERRIHGIVGPNGSGKTTLLNVISGFGRLDAGSVLVKGQDTTRMAADRIARLGVGRTFQTPRIFEDLSIWDNLAIGADFHGGRGGASAWLTQALAPVEARWRSELPELLPHAQRRILEVMRAAATGCGILLLDEPAAGLSAEERREFAKLLRLLRDKLGRTIVLIEHDLDLVWRVADRITVLDAGVVVADGAPAAIVADRRVQGLFVGSRDAAG